MRSGHLRDDKACTCLSSSRASESIRPPTSASMGDGMGLGHTREYNRTQGDAAVHHIQAPNFASRRDLGWWQEKIPEWFVSCFLKLTPLSPEPGWAAECRVPEVGICRRACEIDWGAFFDDCLYPSVVFSGWTTQNGRESRDRASSSRPPCRIVSR